MLIITSRLALYLIHQIFNNKKTKMLKATNIIIKYLSFWPFRVFFYFCSILAVSLSMIPFWCTFHSVCIFIIALQLLWWFGRVNKKLTRRFQVHKTNVTTMPTYFFFIKKKAHTQSLVFLSVFNGFHLKVFRNQNG